MNKPIKTDKQGKVSITRYRFNQLKKHKNPRQVVKVIQALLDAQNEKLSSSAFNSYMKVATDHLLQPVEKVNAYKNGFIFII